MKIVISKFFSEFLYESVCGKLATTTTIRIPAEDLQETKNVGRESFCLHLGRSQYKSGDY